MISSNALEELYQDATRSSEDAGGTPATTSKLVWRTEGGKQFLHMATIPGDIREDDVMFSESNRTDKKRSPR